MTSRRKAIATAYRTRFEEEHRRYPDLPCVRRSECTGSTDEVLSKDMFTCHGCWQQEEKDELRAKAVVLSR